MSQGQASAPPRAGSPAVTSPAADAQVVHEFFAPFAHIEGRYEWCRIRSPTHGVFDTFIVLGASTSVPATVYVNSVLGARFMAERYPECTTIRVAPAALQVTESPDGRTVTGRLESAEGPIRKANMTLRAPPAAIPRDVPYGGQGFPVWGGRWTCSGVDLNLDGACDGNLEHADGRKEALRGHPCIVTLGSFARIAPRST